MLVLRKAKFWVTHLVPRTHVSDYHTDGGREVAVWRQWLTFVWAHRIVRA